MKREILKIMTDNGAGKEPTPFHNIEITEYSLTQTRMGMPQLTATVMFAKCLDKEWTQREFVTLNGERYYIRHTPTSSKSNTDARYKHDIIFRTERDELLGNVYFYDTVYDETSLTIGKPVANSTKFSFYGNIREFVDRMNCAFRYAGVGDSILKKKTTLDLEDKPVGDGYCAVFDPYGGFDDEITKELSFDNVYILNAISESYNQFEIPFKFDGKRIIFGAADEIVSHTFKYGANNELLSITKTNANAKIINKVSFKGSSENIPYYYPNETEYGHIVARASQGNAIINDGMIELLKPNVLVAKTKQEAENPIYLVYEHYDTEYFESSFSNLKVIASPESDNSTIEKGVNGLNSDIPPSNWYKITKSYKFSKFVKLAFDITFTLEHDATVEITEIMGYMWANDLANVNSASNAINILSSAMRLTLTDLTTGAVLMSDVAPEDRIFNLGYLSGDKRYGATIQFSMYYNNYGSNTSVAYVGLKSATVGSNISNKPSDSYYWKQGDKRFQTTELFGIKLNISAEQLAEAAKHADAIYWTAVEPVPFQENLMPPLYRDTLGVERFYKALNEPENEQVPNVDKSVYIDPDTNKYYIFPNPYVDGAPSEYIYVNEDIKPTIEGVTNSKGQLFGVIADIAYDSDDNDSLKPDVDEGSDADSANYEHSFFYIKLNIFDGEYGFDLFNSASQTDAMTLQMIEGDCNGCKFKIQAYETTENGVQVWKNPVQTTSPDGSIVKGNYREKIRTTNIQAWQQSTMTNSIWICVQKDAETFGVIMPNKGHNYKPKVGDKFNIINIDLPLGYIKAAEKRGMEEAIRYMADNNEEKFTFSISASRIFFAKNPHILSQVSENSKIIVEYDKSEYELYVSSITYNYKTNEPLPDIQINLTDTIAVGQNFVQRISAQASSLIANAYTMGGALGGSGGGLSAVLAERRYLNKQKSDRTPYKLASDVGFEVGEFMSGNRGGLFYIDQETGQSHIEVDQLRVRMKAIFEELMIQQVDTIGGELMVTAGGAVRISAVEKIYRNSTLYSHLCYFKANDEEQQIECKFKAGDWVICKQSNLVEGESRNSANRYYWLRVLSVDNESSFVELSAVKERGMDEPLPNDIICQLGNVSDPLRQNAIILSTTDEFSPCVTLYSGITNASLVDKAVIEYGVDKTTNPPQPFFRCYGNAFIGFKDKSGYLDIDNANKKIRFKGELDILSTVNDGKDSSLVEFVAEKVNDEFDDMEIGSRNLLRNTGQSYTVQSAAASRLPDVRSTYKLIQGQQYTIRCNSSSDFSSTAFINLNVVNSTANVRVSDKNTNTNSGTTFTWELPDSYVYVVVTSLLEQTTVSELMLVQGAKMTSNWTAAPEDTDYMYKSLLDAERQSTSISGGLILSSLIALGQELEDGHFTVMSGLNGLYDDKANGGGIAFWAGGNMVDAETAKENEIPATAVIRMDGTGYMAGNTIRFKEQQVELGDNLQLNDTGLSLMDGDVECVRITNQSMPTDISTIGGTGSSINRVSTSQCNVWDNGLITSPASASVEAAMGTIALTNLSSGYLSATLTVTISNVANTSVPHYLTCKINGANYRTVTLNQSGSTLTATVKINNISTASSLTISGTISRGTVSNIGQSVHTGTINATLSGQIQNHYDSSTILGNDGFISSWNNTFLGINPQMVVMRAGDFGVQVNQSGISLLLGNNWRKITVDSDNTLKLE